MKFKIYAPLQMQFASMILCYHMNNIKKGSTEIVTRIDPKDDKHIWIMYNNSLSWALPKHFISYQTEQKGTHWFNERYYDRLSKSIAVWEYNEVNLPAYQHLNNNISIVSPGVLPQPKVKKDIDLLFYGDLSPRREKAVKTIPSMSIVKKLLGPPMRDLLNRVKTVVNIHYYDESPLETFRINEALSHNCNVVSENSLGADKYKEFVKFASIDHLGALALGQKDEFNMDISKLCNLEEIKNALSKI